VDPGWRLALLEQTEQAFASTPRRRVEAAAPLTERELVVLRLLSTRLSTREISRELSVSGHLFNQGDILATAVPEFPVVDLAGFIGSSLWALWVIALGVAVLRAPVRRPTVTAVPVQATPRADPA
jgi:hypothetical protein